MKCVTTTMAWFSYLRQKCHGYWQNIGILLLKIQVSFIVRWWSFLSISYEMHSMHFDHEIKTHHTSESFESLIWLYKDIHGWRWRTWLWLPSISVPVGILSQIWLAFYLTFRDGKRVQKEGQHRTSVVKNSSNYGSTLLYCWLMARLQ